jgi:hypothetical protein
MSVAPSARRRPGAMIGAAVCLACAVVAACASGPDPSESPALETRSTTDPSPVTAASGHDPSPPGTSGPSATRGGPDGSQDPSATDAAKGTNGVIDAMQRAIVRVTPLWVRLELAPDELDGDLRLDGTADDGLGAGRLFVAVSLRRGTVLADPCRDRDFRQGGRCETRRLVGGDLLALRDVVAFDGTTTIVVALIHRDGTGVVAEASNFTLEDVGVPMAASGGPGTRINRPLPVYSLDQLAKIAIEVDRAVAACQRAGCP